MRKSVAELAIFVVLALVTGCKGHASVNDSDAESITETLSAEAGTIVPLAAGDAGAGASGPTIAILDQTTPVFTATEWPASDPSKASEERQGVTRLGYLRRGAVVPVKSQVIKKSNCAEGWYELASGGFVCGKYATTDLSHKDLTNAPHAPNLEGPLPYDYGLNLTNGTPLYRRRPFRAERRDLEKGLAVGKTKPKKPGEEAVPAAESEGGDTPWYLKDHKGQRPQVKIDDIRTNEAGGLVVVRMVRGFYLALDKELSTSSGKFWRNTMGYLAPADHILVHKTKTEFEGVKLTAAGEKRHLPLGWVVGPRVRRYEIDSEGDTPKRARRGDTIDRFTIVQLTGKKAPVEDHTYFETEEGYWVRDVDMAIARTTAVPKDVPAGEKWIDVNLTTQTLVAYEGDKPIFATIVSTGRKNSDPAKDHRTVQGSFAVREKHVAATMEDDGASDGPYSIQDVPWIMYFERGYALHGAFWHAQFGRERSHGCVNLQPADARTVFMWAGPKLPDGWHGIKATKDNPGTRVIVHE